MKKIILETYGRKVYGSSLISQGKTILSSLNILLVYLFKYTLGILAIAFIIVIITSMIFNLDSTTCSYHSKLITMEGKCSQIFTIVSYDNNIMTLIGADYDYNSWDTLLDWNEKIIDQSLKMNLTKNETESNLERFMLFTDDLNKAHDIIYR